MLAIKQKMTSLYLLHHFILSSLALTLQTYLHTFTACTGNNEKGKWRQREARTPPSASPLPHFPICYVLTSPLTHKSNTVELNSICTLRDSKQGGRWMWREAEWGGRRTGSIRVVGKWREDQSVPGLSLRSLVFTSIYLHCLPFAWAWCPSRLSSGRPQRFCRHCRLGPTII